MLRVLLRCLFLLLLGSWSAAACGGSALETGAAGASGSGGGASSDFQSCTSNADCVRVAAGCCSCGAGPIANFTALNARFVEQYGRACETLNCAACPPSPEDPNDPVAYYVPTCQAGRCAVVDLRTLTSLTGCSVDADCMLRSGADCCSGCNGQAVALHLDSEAQLEALVCGAPRPACSHCQPLFSGYSASCANGQCRVNAHACTAQDPCPL